jgi:two-component system, LytTR family, sensor histidine kinase AlgZ
MQRPPMTPEPSIIRSTLRALLHPRRLVPVVLVSASLVAAQGNYSRDPFAVPLGIAMCGLFVVVAPVSWRVLFPERLLDLRHGGIRLILYGAIGAGVVLSLGVVVPRLLDMGRTLMTAPTSIVVCMALFLVGGFGLGRDIWLENSLARAEARAAELGRDAERAQLLALRSHLDPHFLFNTLNAIAEWCREDGEVAERAILQLSSMLRSILEGVKRASWPLDRELELARNLMALHRLRDPDRFTFAVEVDPAALRVAVPPMILLPLAENAVKHGPAAGHRGEIRLVARYDGESSVVVSVSNPGPYRGPRPGSDGIPVLQRRLALAYGEPRLVLAGAGDRTTAELVLPMSGPAGTEEAAPAGAAGEATP